MVFVPTGVPWLECVIWLALRGHLAGPKMIGTAVCNGKTSSRLRRLLRRSFELEFDLNRPAQPRLSDLAWEIRYECRPQFWEGGRTRRREGRLR